MSQPGKPAPAAPQPGMRPLTYKEKQELAKQQTAGQVTVEDKGLFETEAFDRMKQEMAGAAPAWLNYTDYSPIYYFKYFMTEAVASGESEKLVDSFRLLFRKDGKSLRLKAGLEPQGGPHNYTFAGNGADVWREALKKIMLLGFKAVRKNELDQPSASLANAMLEDKFVRYIGAKNGTSGATEVEVFWRCDGRAKEMYIEGQTCTCHVKVAENSQKFNLRESWHPFSEKEIRSKLWLRAYANIDNDYYTIVSVGLDFRTCSAFPTLDEKKAYSWRLLDGYTMAPPSRWTDDELRTHRDKLALVEAAPGGRKIRVATVTYAYMMALNSGVVIDTTSWAGDKGAAKFPERGVRGIPKECFVAYIPLLRIHHGPARADGFTLFRHPQMPPQMLLTPGELDHRFGNSGAAFIRQQYDSALESVDNHLRSAWASTGFGDPGDATKISQIIQYPAAPVKAGDPALG